MIDDPDFPVWAVFGIVVVLLGFTACETVEILARSVDYRACIAAGKEPLPCRGRVVYAITEDGAELITVKEKRK